MNVGQILFSQVIECLHPEQFRRCVSRYPMARRSKSMSAWDHFLCMAFAQMTFRESLRDIEACLAGRPQLCMMGIRGNVTRTNLAYAGEHRDWRVFADLAARLIIKARRLYAGDTTALDIEQMVYALDSTTIDLCLTLFPWAKFRTTKSAIKLHTLIDLHGRIPVFISITEGKVHDVNILDVIAFEAGSIYVMDRGYVDFQRLHGIHLSNAFFVLRAKSNLRFYVIESRTVDPSSGVRCDQIIRLKTTKGKTDYPERLRRIRYVDPETRKSLVFITNHFELPALTVAAIYKNRWQIELFFKWIKQNLRIKAFYGTNSNAVRTQIWIAICVYLMVAIFKKQHGIEESLGRILQVLSVNVFSKDPVNQLLTTANTRNEDSNICNQLIFNGF
ncbi:MAG TPA: IS4 family transposase [Chryseolinea sp.]